ncbi:hypothetical protein E5163_09610 [Marinicauda algicola]|uniref:Uncharacterized protein n=1 Tax=Marinicauda algicola TaxID=2029849 RepID=A0A4V3RXW8_9PROT|nr:hypothetical protein [Marinicauda algicola]TGY88089.1 hypothetical protein E5163_09610 [Marinicauda algicola]
MIAELVERLSAGFQFLDWMVLIMAAIVAALVMTRWSQITAAALIAYAIDLAIRFAGLVMATENVPLNYAMSLALARLDEHGLAATLRPFLYFAAIAAIFWVKRRYGGR